MSANQLADGKVRIPIDDRVPVSGLKLLQRFGYNTVKQPSVKSVLAGRQHNLSAGRKRND
ncbi:MAG: hypothetical protein AB7P14_12410 [Blastocatellales bacterium]